MDIQGGRRSGNIEDRRGMRPGRAGVGLSLGGIAVLIVMSLLGINPLPFLGLATQQSPQAPQQQPDQPYQESAQEAQFSQLAAVTLGETEATWGRLFGGKYPAPTMVFFTEATNTGCGGGQAAMGPFYCPADQKVYIDLSFFNELEQRFGAPGQFAQAYVIAHEVGHHVQYLTGMSEKVQRAQQAARGKAEANQYSVMLELQADCYAGVWAHDAAPRLKITAQDVEDGLRAATAIGDDTLQRAAQGRVVPDAFTHGSSEQRARWLKTGMESGDPQSCDTFNSRNL